MGLTNVEKAMLTEGSESNATTLSPLVVVTDEKEDEEMATSADDGCAKENNL